MKLGAREASFKDFGFDEFLTPLGQMMQGQQVDQSTLLATEPKNLNKPQTRTNYETKLVYQLPLFTGFKLSSAKDMARLQVQAQKAKLQYDEKQLALEVLKAYNGAVAAKYFIDATQKAKKATLSFVTFAQEMYNEGYITNIDVDQATLYDLKIDSMLIEAKNKYALAIAYLKFLTNDTTITDVDDFQTIKTNNAELVTLQKKALNLRADLEWMKNNNLTMKKKIDYEKSGNYPMIGAHLEYGLNDNQLNNFDTSKEYFVAAVGLEYKIFNGLSTKTAVNKAKIQSAQTNHYYQMMEDGVKLQVEKAYLNLQTNNKILKEKIKAEQLANSVLERSQELYTNQLIKMNDLLLEQANLQKARAETILAKYNKTIAAAELKLAVGEDLIKE
jgi:outer membrane protein TolC